MALRVHSADRYAEVADFDPVSGTLIKYERADAPNPEEPQRGRFAQLAGRLAVLFRPMDDSLRLMVGLGTISLDDTTEIRWSRSKSTAHLTIRHDGSVWLKVEYPLSDGFRSFEREYIPTPFAEAEDFDFGLFLANVAGDHDRQQRLYRQDH